MTHEDKEKEARQKFVFTTIVNDFREMSMLLGKNNNMGSSPLLHEFKRQTSFFFKEKIKTARLALTDVTPAQLLTEEATNGDLWPPDTRILGVISRSAFEVDDYYRIVDIIHKRLIKFERKNWRVSYKTLLLLEHLLTHGPLSIAKEFQNDKDVIEDMGSFQFVDEKGFNWGSSVRNLSQRILKLLENGLVLKEERAIARKVTREIQGFGSFSRRSFLEDESFKGLKMCERCNSNYDDQQDDEETEFLAATDKLLVEEKIQKDISRELEDTTRISELEVEGDNTEDHPFVYNDGETTASFL